MLNNLTTRHEYPGKLFVVEGIDGSGKTTQLALLAKWLSAAGHPVFVTEWNSSALVKAATKSGKKKNSLTPMTFSLLHATDFADRLLYNIIPPLKAGMIVLADRYAYTAFSRDAARGVDRRWVRELYSFAVRPDLAVYFRVPIEVSTDRLLARRVKLKFYEAGLDMGWSTNAVESFKIFQGKVLEEYDRIVDEYELSVIAASGSITDQQRTFRKIVSQHLAIEDTNDELDELPEGANGGARPGSYYGNGIPYLPIQNYPGQDHRGRGHRRRRPVDTDHAAAGVARGPGLRRHRDRLDAIRVDAADDRAREVEQHAQQADLRPALRDRLRRSPGEGDHPGAQGRVHRALRLLHLHGDGPRRRARRRSHWIRSLYGFAIAPHLVFYLKVDEKTLIRRVLQARGMDYWESAWI